MRLRRYISLLACAAGVVLFFTLNANAQPAPPDDQLALGVSPAITELIVEPGESKELRITVTNLTNEPLSVKAAASAFRPTEKIAEKDRAIFDASLWIKFDEPDFILQAGQQRPVTITITPPDNAEPGGHYATTLFQPLVPVAPDQSIAAYIGTKVGVLNLIIIKGDLQEILAIDGISAPALNQRGPVELTLDLQNRGNVHLLPTGTVEIFNAWGKRIETLSLPPTLVLPQTTKQVSLTWDNKKRIGYYKAKATITYGASSQNLASRSIRILILPWLNLIWLIIGGSVVGVVCWRTRGRWRKAMRILFNR